LDPTTDPLHADRNRLRCLALVLGLMLSASGCGEVVSSPSPDAAPTAEVAPAPDESEPAMAPAQEDGQSGAEVPSRAEPPAPPDDPAITHIVASEELILELTPRLKELGHSLENLELPDHASRYLFASRVDVLDLAPGKEPIRDRTLPSVSLDMLHLEVEQASRKVAASRIRLWRPLLDRLRYLDWAKLYFVRGHFLDDDRSRFEGDVGFAAAGVLDDGSEVGLSGHQEIEFAREASSSITGKDDWKIVSWHLHDLVVQRVERPLFSDVLAEILPDPETLRRAKKSLMHDHIVEFATNPDFVWPTPYFSPHAADRHPGLAVADVNGDGFDDIYFMDRWGRNLLLVNRGDGTFEDRAQELGLDLENHCTSAVFADFDNDGDPDLFLGRSLERSRYYENTGKRFEDRSASHVSLELPYLVSSVTAVDYDGDGLLDVYLATFAADVWQRQVSKYLKLVRGDKELEKSLPEEELLAYEKGRYLYDFLPDAQAEELFRRTHESHIFMGRPGPPNVLLHNVGNGKFELAPQSESLAVWRNTFQATWADFDDDGDPDVYLSNDFGPNNFFRNDDGVFVDITAETDTGDVGFGMGAAWGDYDLDGRQDLYVTNMFSKAGRRITAQIDQLDPRIPGMARGNSLFRNEGPAFRKVSGLEAPALLVEAGGWGWGSQLVDVDNDGDLDVYAPCGNYTAPAEIAVILDT